MTILNEKLVRRWNKVMYAVCYEHITINTNFSELETQKIAYGVKDGISAGWMLKEAKYLLLCYYESGHCRCDDRFIDKECYKMWVSETGMLKRLIAKLEAFDESEMIVLW